MWLNSKGFFMSELLLSLSAWLMATSILLPLAIFLLGHSMQIRQEADALHLLYERLQEMKLTPELTGNSSIERNGIIFRFKVSAADQESPERVCVEFNDFKKKTISKCASAE
jgi:hypothetical protein